MIDILKHLLDLIGKRVWFILAGGVLLIVAVLSLTISYPITLQVNSCVLKEEQYQLHNTTYMIRSVVEKTGGASVKFCIKEVYKTVKNNLVEK